MRLLLISSEFPPGPGGIANHAHCLLLGLRELGWIVSAITPQDYASEQEVRAFNDAQPFPILRVRSGRGRLREMLARVRVVLRTIHRESPRVVIGTGLSGVWLAALAGRFSRLPTLGIAHGSEIRVPGASQLVNRAAFYSMNVVVAVSAFTAGLFPKAGIHPRNIRVIPNAADPARFRIWSDEDKKRFRVEHGLNGGPVLLTIGHVSVRKGQETVIRALPAIANQFPSVQYVMVGLPTLQPELSALARQLGVAGNIRFAGRVTEPDKIGWLNTCDIFLMTSRTTATGDCEGFGIAAVEAAFCGKPAIVSAGSGLVEAIKPGVTGIAVAEADAAATSNAVLQLLQSDIADSMGEAARRRALAEQTWQRCAIQYDAVLRQLVCS